MPRTRRRTGSKKGKTLRQIALAARAQWKKDMQAAHRAKMLARADAIRAHAEELSRRAQEKPTNEN